MRGGKAEGERKGNRGAHSAGGKSALFIFSSLQPLSFSLCPFLSHPVISIYHQAAALLPSLFYLFHTLHHARSCLTPSHSLSSLSLTISPASLLPASVFHRRFRKSQPLPSIYEIAHVISCPPPQCPALSHKSQWMHPLSADSPCMAQSSIKKTHSSVANAPKKTRIYLEGNILSQHDKPPTL